MEKKYELLTETKAAARVSYYNGVTGNTYHVQVVYRIRALKDFGDVEKGQLGGWVETEKNLSQDGDCWIYDDAKVYEAARVCDDARIAGQSQIFGNAKVYGNTIVDNSATVSDDAEIYGNARVIDDARIFGHAKVYGNAFMYDQAIAYGHAEIFENASVYGSSSIHGKSKIYGRAILTGRVHCCGNVRIFGNVIMRHFIDLNGNGSISTNEFLVVGPIGSRSENTLFQKNEDTPGGISVFCGCFYGSIDEFETAVRVNHNGSEHERNYLAAISFAKSMLL